MAPAQPKSEAAPAAWSMFRPASVRMHHCTCDLALIAVDLNVTRDLPTAVEEGGSQGQGRAHGRREQHVFPPGGGLAVLLERSLGSKTHLT